MTVSRDTEYLVGLFHELRKQPHETEWLEFKHNNDNPEQIGEYISALANSAALSGKVHGYMLWGVTDDGHDIVGTKFRPSCIKQGNEELENWLLRLLTPKINFCFYELIVKDMPVVLLEIGAAFRHPVQFKNQEFIRLGSYKKKLKDFPEKERELWRVFDQTPFEQQIAAENIPAKDILCLLDYPAYFDLLKIPLPETHDAILSALQDDNMIAKKVENKWNITNLGAVLFSKKLSNFSNLQRKAVRVIVYKENNRVETVREQEGIRGYACGFEGLISFVINFLPVNEVIGQALRKEVPMFPKLAIRELVANALIHQDLQQTGTGPMIEIFSDRMEITNPGVPLVKTERFLDSPPKSRNEVLASFMRRIGVCEERGSGIDKVVSETEFYQLPAPLFEKTDEHTRCVLFSHREFKDMDKQDRIRATYHHACLCYVERNYMTNSTLRKRFGIEEQNSAMASRIIKDALEAKEIRPLDENSSKKYMKYVPMWA
jgi:predicted HTH transcriptional regulator